MRITVSIVEDDSGTREKLMEVVGRTPNLRCLHAYPNGEKALIGIPENTPDVVLMDISLPGMSGIQCVGQLKAKLPKVQILMLTTYEDTKLIFESLRAGAAGYLLKNMPTSELVQAVENVSKGGSPMSMSIARKVVDHFRQFTEPSSEVEKLTVREQEILGLLAQGFLYKEIADQLQISPGTVKVHLHTVYEKLHVSSRTEAVIKFLKK